MATQEPEAVSPTSILPALPGQAALFDDPRRLLTLPLPELRQVAAEAAREGSPIFARLRRVYGLVAWAMWNQLPELAYSDFERDYAADLGVPPPTLRRWRRDVVASDDLPVPAVAAVRATAARSVKLAPKTAGQPPSATKNGSNEGLPNIPPSRQPTSAPSAPSAPPASSPTTRLPDPGPPPTTKANVAHLLDHLHALDPDEAGAAMTASQLDVLMDWTERAVKAAPKRKKATRPKPARTEPKADCSHPVTRRIGNACGACGATVKG